MNKNDGFTLAELMIATSVFSVVLLLCTTALLQVGRQFYKGVTGIRAQSTARNVVSDLQNALQFSKNDIVFRTSNTSPQVFSLCVEGKRYSYILDTQLDTSAASYDSVTKKIRHVLWKDSPLDENRCLPANLELANPSSSSLNVTGLSAPTAADNGINGQELMPASMRLLDLSTTNQPAGTNLWMLSVSIIAGDTDVINTNGNANPQDDNCVATSAGGQFCSKSALQTTILRRLL